MLWAAIFPSINVATDSGPRGHPPQRRAVRAAGRRAPQRRALPASRAASPSRASRRCDALNKGREITLAMADMFSNELREMELDARGDRAGGVRDVRYGGVGDRLVAGRRRRQPAPDAADEFVAHLTTIMVGAINGTCELLGIKIDPDQPINTAVRRQQPVA